MACKEYDGVEVENQDVEKTHGVTKCTCKSPPTYIYVYINGKGDYRLMITTILIEALMMIIC
jgi:hypothetical protein